MKKHFIKFGLILGLICSSFATLGANCCPQDNSCYQWNPCCNEKKFFFGADFLYWNVHQSNLDFASELQQLGQELPYDVKFIDYDWDVGYRITGGYRFCDSPWSTKLVFTSYCQKNSKEVSTPEPLLFTTIYIPVISFTFMDASVELDYKVLDWIFERKLCLCHSFEMSPFIGVRGLWLDQKLEVLNTDDNALLDVTFDSDLKSIGLVVGSECSVNVCGNFSLYGQCSGSILAAKSDIDSIIELGNSISFGSEKEYTALLGFQIGVGANYYLDCFNCFDSVLRLGYEMSYWNDVPSYRRTTQEGGFTVTTNGNSQHLLLHGLTLRAEVNF